MIAQLVGGVINKSETSVVLDVGGVGYEVLMSQSDLEQCQVDEDLRLHTYFHVRENAQELFGFIEAAGKQLFTQLISVNGVGPKSALAIMGLGEAAQIKSAIASGNLAFLSGASGVGKKAAEKIVLDLKDKVGIVAGQDVSMPEDDDALAALVALGYSRAHAAQALTKIDPELSTQERVTLSLKELS